MKTHRWMLSLIIVLSFASVALGGQPEPTANVRQTDLPSGYYCNVPPSSEFAPVPVDATLTTEGGPVLLSVVLDIYNYQGPTANVQAYFTVDGQPLANQSVWAGAAMNMSLTPTRVIEVTAGAHTFGVSIACHTSDPLYVRNAWLSAYELPLIRK